jgi:hypothetical protein
MIRSSADIEAPHVAPTPGPWAYEPAHIEDGAAMCPRIVSLHPDYLYVQIADIQRTDSPRRMANAHLIAAAPELLEALKNLVGLAEMRGKLHEFKAALDVAQVAIEKAEGR